MPLPKISKHCLCVLLTAVMLFTGSVIIEIPQAEAESYQSQISKLEEKQAELQTQIDILAEDIEEQEALRDVLLDQMDTVQEQIDLYNDQMAEIQKEIDTMEQTKIDIENSIEDKRQMFLNRVRAMYIAGNNSALAVLLGADDFADYLYQDELLASITEYDNTIMNELREDIEEINTIQAQMEEQQKEILALRSEVDIKQQELGDVVDTYNAVIGDLEEKKDELQFDVDAYEEEIEKLEQKIQEAADAAKGDAEDKDIVYGGEGFIWPCPNYYYISSHYGQRWGRLHKGTDIAGSNIYGKPIVAAADGVVTLVDYNDGGYGYYVMINHGNKGNENFVTLYAHMSSQAAYVGQTVKAGDVIGYVGNTGRSTGPHLHFEIRVNGNPINPMTKFNEVV